VHFLPTPQVDHDLLIDRIVAERQNGKNANYFTSIHADWKIRVQDYISKSGNPEVLAFWPHVGTYRKTHINLYPGDATSAQGPVIKQLRNRQLQLCPFCGENGAPRTLDHYLPKQLFPELAAMPINLAPMCDACQDEKDTKTVDEESRRFFLHPYFDQIAISQIVMLIVRVPYEAPASFDLVPSLVLAPEWRDLVSRHLKELDIYARFKEYFTDQYVRTLRLVQDTRQAGENVESMLRQFAALHRDRSRNCWDYVFYSGVLNDTSLMAYLTAGNIPNHL